MGSVGTLSRVSLKMSDHLFFLKPTPSISLQVQIKAMLVSAILDGHLAPGTPLPSCRKLAETISVSRNTVVLMYERMMEEGYTNSKERQGYFVNLDVGIEKLNAPMPAGKKQQPRQHWEKPFGLMRVYNIIFRNQSSGVTLSYTVKWIRSCFPLLNGEIVLSKQQAAC